MENNKSVIISGADGFVGSATTNKFLENGYFVVAVVKTKNIKRLDVTNTNLLIVTHDELVDYAYGNNSSELLTSILSTKQYNEYNYESFIDFAWSGVSGNSRNDELLQIKNIGLIESDVFLAKKLKCKKFIGSGSLNELDFELSENIADKNYYQLCKHLCHTSAKNISDKIGIEFYWPIITNAYGAGECSNRIINSTIRKIIHGEEKILFSDATTYYSFSYITDVANAFYLISTKGLPNRNYMICGQEVKPLKEYLKTLVELLSNGKSQCCFGALESTMPNIPEYFYDKKTLYIDTGYLPQITFEQGILLTYKYILEEDSKTNEQI